ncbi:MAG TPA: hypothetical protein VGK56_02535 [Anaerolineales bacterium]
MAARKLKVRHDEETKAKIQASQLINRLQDHVLGLVDLKPTQVTAALGLLKKTIPDLSSAEIKNETTVRYVARLPEKAKNTPAWQQQHDLSQTIQ